MQFAKEILPGGTAFASTEGGQVIDDTHGTPASAVDAGVPAGPSQASAHVAELYKGMYDPPPLTPEQQKAKQLVESMAQRHPLAVTGPVVPPPHARDTIGPMSAAAIQASEREAIWRATPEFNAGIPVDKTLRAKSPLEKILQSGNEVNGMWKWLTQFDGLAPGTGDALPNHQIGPLGRPPTVVDPPSPFAPILPTR
jgi:hypothetical protein